MLLSIPYLSTYLLNILHVPGYNNLKKEEEKNENKNKNKDKKKKRRSGLVGNTDEKPDTFHSLG